MWFAALGNVNQNPWLVHLVYKLLVGSYTARQLLDASNTPFPKAPPKLIRASLYHYNFTAEGAKGKLACFSARGPTLRWSKRSDGEGEAISSRRCVCCPHVRSRRCMSASPTQHERIRTSRRLFFEPAHAVRYLSSPAPCYSPFLPLSLLTPVHKHLSSLSPHRR